MAGVVAAAVVGSALISSQAAKKAAGQQAAASQAATDAQERMFERQVELQEPWRKAGEESLNRLTEGLKPGGEFGVRFTDRPFTADPGYAFRLSEGLKALDRTAAARGGLLSGATLKGAQQYGQDLASQEYQNAFNRYYAERTNMLQPLQSLAGVGQTSANTLTNAAGQFGSQIGSNIIGAGNAAAAGTVGTANAISQGVGQGVNFYQNRMFMDRLFPSSSPAASPSWQQTSTGLYTMD
jgi:hypothetical protein